MGTIALTYTGTNTPMLSVPTLIQTNSFSPLRCYGWRHGAVSLRQRTYLCLHSGRRGWVCNMEGRSTDGGITNYLQLSFQLTSASETCHISCEWMRVGWLTLL